jgi:transcriptional regulator with XRE-family HTH domain
MVTGIEQALLSKYESGKRIPPTESLITLADYYGVSMDYIMGRTENLELNK